MSSTGYQHINISRNIIYRLRFMHKGIIYEKQSCNLSLLISLRNSYYFHLGIPIPFNETLKKTIRKRSFVTKMK